jgi:hypothetical protein
MSCHIVLITPVATFSTNDFAAHYPTTLSSHPLEQCDAWACKPLILAGLRMAANPSFASTALSHLRCKMYSQFCGNKNLVIVCHRIGVRFSWMQVQKLLTLEPVRRRKTA